MSAIHPVYFVKGDDLSLQSEALTRLVQELVGDRAPELTVQEMAEDADVTALLDVCQTPAFLTDLRVIVVREAGRFRADEVDPLIAYLAAPMPSSTLVLVGGGGALPTRLVKAIKEHGHIVEANLPSGKARSAWIAERLKAAPVHLNRPAVALLTERIGEDVGDLSGILDALAAAYGEGATIDAEQVEPYLGNNGVATPWELTDAIDSGDTVTALVQLRRMLDGGRHPLVVMATLQRHVTSLLRLDGSGITSEAEAASVLGVSPFPAKKALAQARRLGSPAIGRAVRLVSEADVELRGASAWPNDYVLEVLVARLSKLAPARRKASA